MVRTVLIYKRQRQQQKQKKVEIKSDWSIDPDNRKDNQARRPMRNEITSDWETEIGENQDTIIEAPFRRLNTMPKVLTSRKGKYPLANWTSVVIGQENNPPKEVQNDSHDLSNLQFQEGDPDAERDSVMMISINISQTYPPVLTLCKPRKGLANWTWVDLGNPSPKFRSFQEEEEFWQKQSKQTANKTIDRQDEEEEDQIQSDGNEERQGKSLKDVE